MSVCGCGVAVGSSKRVLRVRVCGCGGAVGSPKRVLRVCVCGCGGAVGSSKRVLRVRLCGCVGAVGSSKCALRGRVCGCVGAVGSSKRGLCVRLCGCVGEAKSESSGAASVIVVGVVGVCGVVCGSAVVEGAVVVGLVTGFLLQVTASSLPLSRAQRSVPSLAIPFQCLYFGPRAPSGDVFQDNSQPLRDF